MQWGDYDGDGDLDLAVGCYFSNSYPPVPNYEVLIYKNDNGILGANPAWISALMRSTMDVRLVDINKDSRLDLLAVNGSTSYVPSDIYFNSATGLPTSPSWTQSPSAWSLCGQFADIDGDGDLDLAIANQGNTSNPQKPIYVFDNIGGTYATTPYWQSGDQMITNSIAFGDMNNNELQRMSSQFTAAGTGGAFQLPMLPIYKIDSVLVNGALTNNYCVDEVAGWVSVAPKPSAGSIIKIIYRYMPKSDLAASKWVNYQSGVYTNNNGVLNLLPAWTTGTTGGQKGIAWADFDHDGYLDLAISGTSNTVLYRNDHGTMTGPVWVSNSVSPSAQELITGDLDRDGYPELAVVHFSSKRVEIFKNRNGVLDTSPTWLYIAGTSATSISFGDMNGDGYLDLAVGTARSPIVVFLNQGNPCNEVTYDAGWNLIGVPLLCPNMAPGILFPTANSPAFGYSNGYQSADTVRNGKAYWLRFPSAGTSTVCGQTVSQTTIPITAGWNMITVYDRSAAVSSLTTTPANIINSSFYGYQTGYVQATELAAGKGYWVRSSSDGVINLPPK
jgi:hypothetical protein